MTVGEFVKECVDYGDMDADIFICVDKWLLKPIEEERFAYISIKEVKPFGSCMYCEPVYSSGIDYQGLPSVKRGEEL